MNRRDYFLACLNVHLSANPSCGRYEVAEIQKKAWLLPDEAIPSDPASAALEFHRYYTGHDQGPPRWLEEWEEIVAQGSERSISKLTADLR